MSEDGNGLVESGLMGICDLSLSTVSYLVLLFFFFLLLPFSLYVRIACPISLS